MAKSRYEYVKEFESDPLLLPECWIAVRIDGHSFHKFTVDHKFAKPNDVRGLRLMNRCAEEVFRKFSDVVFAIGMSDEFSFVLRRDAALFDRRTQKINSSIVSHFSSCYIFHWLEYMGAETPLQYVPSFDSRVVLYPTDRALRDYLSWRQVDCHINNLYNTCFWALVERAGHSQRQAEKILKDTNSAQKNEMLFSQFGVNYNNEPAMFRKGSIFARHVKDEMHHAPDGREFVRQRLVVSLLHEDLIQDDFWMRYPVIPLPRSSVQVATAASAACVEMLEQGIASLKASSDAEDAAKRGADVDAPDQ